MTKLLLRLFVRDHQNSEDPAVRASVGKLAGITGIACNMLLFAMKLIVGVLSGAVSVIADALNNLSDAASSVVTLLGFHLAQRPADPDHPYGHARYEYISGLTVAAVILVIGFELAKSAVSRIFAPTSVSFAAVTLGVLLCSIGIKLWMSSFFSSLGKKIGSATLKATSVDSRNDVIASAAVLLGCLAERLFQWKIDGFVGLAVAVFILYSGIGVARETVSALLGQQADKKLLEDICRVVCEHDKVLGIHDLLVHDYGPGRCYASVHVELSADEDPLMCHDMIDHIESDVLEELNVNLVIHYDPVLENDAEWTKARRLTEELVKKLDSAYSIHDFRLVRSAAQTKLVFDLAIPYQAAVDTKAIKQQIDAMLSAQNLPYEAVIRIDRQ